MADLKSVEPYQDFAECIEVVGGYVIRHRESHYEYMTPQPSEPAAWENFRWMATAIGQGIGALLEMAPIVTIRLDQGTIKPVGRPAKPKN